MDNLMKSQGLHIVKIGEWAAMLSFYCVLVGASPAAYSDEASDYVGNIYSLGDLPGFAFRDNKNRTPDAEYLQVLFVEDKYFLLAQETGERHVEVVDVITIPKGQVFIGRPVEDECRSKKRPDETIFVVGKWVSRSTPKRGFAGGYAKSISKAWRVNFSKKKFDPIPTAGIRCEDNRTEADVD
jgi:hypothetical protein